MKVQSELAYVLHRRDYLESSFIVEILTSTFGWKTVVARGARRKKRTPPNLLQPFQRLRIGWRGSSELSSLTDWEFADICYPLSGERLYSGMYLNEVTTRMARKHELDPEIFTAYETTLRALCCNDNPEPALRIYEKRLLQAAGYGMLLTNLTDRAEPIVSHGRYRYAAGLGPVMGAGESNAIPVQGETLLALDAESLAGEAVLRDAKRLMRFVLRTHLGAKPLLSRALYAQSRQKSDNQ